MLATLRRWWRGKHETPGPGALLTEFSVVIAGVFGAQQLSNWTQDRAELREVEGLYRDLTYSYGQYRLIAQTYEKAIPCLEQRVNLISRLASEGKEVSPELLAPTKLMMMGPDDLTRDDDRLLRERFGNRTADLLGNVQFNLSSIQENGRRLEQGWFAFQRVDPRGGQIDLADRDAARQAAVEIKGNLYALDKGARMILNLTNLLGIQAKRGATLLPVTNCQQMWREGRGYVELNR